MPFLNSLIVEYVANQSKAGVIAPLDYQDDDGAIYTVPAGFLTDFASVPRLPFAYMIAGGRVPMASTLHDRLCATGEVSRKDADAIYKRAIRDEGSGAFIQSLMYAGVRIGAFLGIGRNENDG